MLRRILPVLAATIGLAPAFAAQADLVYFVSRTTGGLHTFDTSGGGITPLTGTNTFPTATALAMGPDGNLYVGDATGGGSIRRYSMAGGSVSTVVTLSGSNPAFGGGPVSPTALAFTPGGAMLVGRNPESQFSGYPAGQVLEVVGWGSGSPTVQNFTSGGSPNYQTGLAVAPDGTLYASNTKYDIFAIPQPALVGNVLKFSSSGTFQSVIAADGTGTGGLSGPTGLGVFGSSLFIASAMNGKVYKTDLTNPNTATNTVEFATSGGDFLGPLTMLVERQSARGERFRTGRAHLRVRHVRESRRCVRRPAYGQIGGIVAVPEPAAALAGLAGVSCVGVWRLRRRPGS